MSTKKTQLTTVPGRVATKGSARAVTMVPVLLAGLATLTLATPTWAQRYLTERVIKGIQVQSSAFKVAPGFVAVRTGPNEITVRQAKDAKSVEGKLECDCSGVKKGAECGVEVVQDQVVCKGAGCQGGNCKVKAASGWKLP